jgi:CBS domain-containing protein
MTKAAVSDQPSDSLSEAARKMWDQQTGSLLVMEGEQLLGIITERDILRAVATGTELDKTRVEEVMVRDLITIEPGASLRAAAHVMTDKWIRHLPVLDRGKLVGIISQRDLAGVLGAALNEPEALEQLIDDSELARERRLSRIEAGVWD